MCANLTCLGAKGKKLQELQELQNKKIGFVPRVSIFCNAVFSRRYQVSGIKFRKLRDLCVSVVNFPLRGLPFPP
jgi:hypothetical protein